MVLVDWPRSKVSPPRLRNLVQRKRLIAPLRSALEGGRHVLVVAPGGTGKTTLLAGWAATTPLHVAWYNIDLADRDPRRLLAGMIAAIDRCLPEKTTAARVALERGDGEIAVLDRMLDAVDHHPSVLVLDDFHHLEGGDEISSLFDHLFRHCPERFALAILSRTIPLLGLAGLTAVGAVVGLGQGDLRFDLAESQALLSAHGLSPDRAAQHVRRIGGWAAGLLLLGRAPGDQQALDDSSEMAIEHLFGEALARIPPDQCTFLMESAALGPVTPLAADLILGRGDSRKRFSQIVAAGLFLDQQGDGYRYHDLLTEYLLRGRFLT